MSLAKILLVILVLAAVVVAIVFLMGRFEQTKPAYDQIMGMADQAKTYATDNWQILLASGGTVASTGIGLATYATGKINTAKAQVTQVTDSAKTQIDTITAEKDKIATQLSSYEAQAKSATDQAKQAEAAAAAALKDAQSKSSQQIVDLTNQNTQLKLNLNQEKDLYKELQLRYDELRKVTAIK